MAEIVMPHPRADAAMACLAAGRRTSNDHVFTSDLSVDEAIVLNEIGYQPKGLVIGSSVYHIGFTSTGWSQNQEVPALTDAMYHARQKAVGEMVRAAHAVGGEGVVGVQLHIEMYHAAKHMAEFFAVGTAVSRPAGHPMQGRFFTSDLSGQELFLLEKAGYSPAGLVMGACVYHIARQGLSQWAGQQTQNVEMTNYTSALYEARELAMMRMQNEAAALRAHGVVQMKIEEKSHIWGSHVMEFFAMGTAVWLVAQQHQRLGITPVVGLEDKPVPVVSASSSGDAIVPEGDSSE